MATGANTFFHLVYVSQAIEDLGYKDIEAILASAKAYNKENSITGSLIYCDGFFIHLLEGKTEKAVKQTLARIIVDERHNNLRVIGEWASETRLFEKTPIGFCDSDLHKEKDCFGFVQKLFSDALPFTFTKSNDVISFFHEFAKSGIELK